MSLSTLERMKRSAGTWEVEGERFDVRLVERELGPELVAAPVDGGDEVPVTWVLTRGRMIEAKPPG